ncbi:hypothetical protein HELRODRAFT_169449 [Helobdella robusta]|uniref:Uncharacterized protein n=1 Tax=Helobdella robusta TaxID=6412 RepID=T1F1Y2_HELRO|nr:hypothetical protein HELRODRAFT_169449 [Helobdella robusta]ESO08574.1 hypothetical protein HELRODRAFT_169449 [Helobdella robusta]
MTLSFQQFYGENVNIRLLSSVEKEDPMTNESTYKTLKNRNSNADYIVPSYKPDSNSTNVDLQNPVHSSHFFLYFIIAFCMISLVLALVFLVAYIMKRAKLNRLRHHLMPLYKFDPGDDEPQLQADLLEDDRDQQMSRSANHMKLKFTSQNSDANNNV